MLGRGRSGDVLEANIREASVAVKMVIYNGYKPEVQTLHGFLGRLGSRHSSSTL